MLLLRPSQPACAVLLLTLASPALAQSDENKEGDQRLAQAVKETGEACGSKLTVTYDWKSEQASPGKPGYQGPLYCKSIVDAFRSACGDADAKPIVAGAVTAIHCRFEQGASKRKELPSGGGAVLKLSGTALDVSYDWNSSNLDSEAYAWLTRRMETPWPNGVATLEARQEKKRGERELAEAVEGLNQACGSKIEASYDWSSEKASPAKPAWQGFLYCRGVLDGLKTMCSDAEGKPIFLENVKAVRCRFEAGASKSKALDVNGGAVLQLAGTTVTASYDWLTANIDGEAVRWAMKKMPTPGENGPATIEAKKERTEGVTRFAAAVASLNERCGAKIAASYDFPSEKGSAAKPAWQGYLYCKSVIDGLGTACSNPKGKAKVAKRVKSVACKFRKGAANDRRLDVGGGAVLEMKGTTLGAEYDWNSANIDGQAFQWAERNL
jgi:hypothetical protein